MELLRTEYLRGYVWFLGTLIELTKVLQGPRLNPLDFSRLGSHPDIAICECVVAAFVRFHSFYVRSMYSVLLFTAPPPPPLFLVLMLAEMPPSFLSARAANQTRGNMNVMYSYYQWFRLEELRRTGQAAA